MGENSNTVYLFITLCKEVSMIIEPSSRPLTILVDHWPFHGSCNGLDHHRGWMGLMHIVTEHVVEC